MPQPTTPAGNLCTLSSSLQAKPAQQHTIARQQASSYGAIRSRPFLVGLLEKGEIPFPKVGSHRRVLLTDLPAYKEADAQQRQPALGELAKLSQEEGMGYLASSAREMGALVLRLRARPSSKGKLCSGWGHVKRMKFRMYRIVAWCTHNPQSLTA